AAGADADGRVRERFEIIHISGWRPDPSQPKPARRGSATVSLAEALKGPRKD
ncbi:MAG TPA: SAM-dependent methyltransferase, partial [Sphingobium sp.]|nr:SAM-dependent methyltransferase [Sphingobium sp.]